MRSLSSKILLVFILFTGVSFGIDLNFDIVKKELEEGIRTKDNASLFIRDYTKEKLHHGYFSNETDWNNSLDYVNGLVNEYRDEFALETTIILAKRLQFNDQYQDAYYFLYKANELNKSIQTKDPELVRKLNEINGSSAYYFHQFEKAEKYLLENLKLPTTTTADSIDYLNTLGLIHSNLKNVEKSNQYFQQGLKLAEKHQRNEWIALLSGNMGLNYYNKGDYKKARILLNRDYHYSTLTKQEESLIASLSVLISMDIKEGNLSTANERFIELEKLVNRNKKHITLKYLYNTKTELLEARGEYKGALEAFKIYKKYQDTLDQKKDKEELLKTEFQINFEQETGKVQLLEEKKKKNETLIYALIFFVLFAIIAFIIIIYQISKRRIQERLIANQEKENMDKELIRTEKEIRNILNNLMQKNEVIELLNSELEIIQSRNLATSEEEKQKIKDKLQTFTLLTDDDWIEFKRLFEFINPDFFNKIQLKFRELTNAEIRLITLIKLNLSNMEMARALGISPDSVRKTNLRLRKKLDLEEQDDLVKVVLSI